MEENTSHPQWLKDFNTVIADSNLRLQELNEKLNNVVTDKGARLDYNLPGSPNIGKSYWGRQQEHQLKEEIQQEKTDCYIKCSNILKEVKESDREPYKEVVREKLEHTRPDHIDPLNKEEVKTLDQSQSYWNAQLNKAKEEKSYADLEVLTQSADKDNSFEASNKSTMNIAKQFHDNKPFEQERE